MRILQRPRDKGNYEKFSNKGDTLKAAPDLLLFCSNSAPTQNLNTFSWCFGYLASTLPISKRCSKQSANSASMIFLIVCQAENDNYFLWHLY